ncbi:S8 family serine peptidase [Actinokineospora enzanensis]|uniref:S8 family serine peptidase n=1 Tax=Actinokineospora enzanensis TaxID=155975 RepID=UPI0003786506|nr:S8 family serine peptidase [Actinokineospora enzanensis]
MVLQDSVATADIQRTAATLSRRYGGTARSYYQTTVHGYSARGLSDYQARRLATDSSVRAVYQDGTARASGVSSSGTVEPVPWGLDRLDQRSLPLDNRPFNSRGGAAATVYLVDTGISRNQAEFGDRARVGADFVGGDGSDCHGHGTQVAGIVGGAAHGVAREIRLVALRALDCRGQGPDSAVLDALEWVNRNGTHPGVILLGLAMDQSPLADQAVRKLVDAEYPTVIPAGDNATDSCGAGRVAESLTIAATDRTDTRLATSNRGPCVTYFAPGGEIPTIGRDGRESRLSGTAPAAAHTAGVVAGYLGTHPYAMPADVRSALARAAVPGAVTDPGTSTPNSMVNVAYPLDPEVPTCRGGGNPGGRSIPTDGTPATSTIAVSGCPPTGAPAHIRVYVDHPRVSDLRLELVDPVGRVSPLPGGTGSGPVRLMSAVSLPGGDRNGIWTLRVTDTGTAGPGRLDQWVLSFE